VARSQVSPLLASLTKTVGDQTNTSHHSSIIDLIHVLCEPSEIISKDLIRMLLHCENSVANYCITINTWKVVRGLIWINLCPWHNGTWLCGAFLVWVTLSSVKWEILFLHWEGRSPIHRQYVYIIHLQELLRGSPHLIRSCSFSERFLLFILRQNHVPTNPWCPS